MFRKLAAASFCAAFAWMAAAAAESVIADEDSVVQFHIPQGLSGFNDELQQLRDIRELARIGKKNPDRTLHYFKRLGDVYRYSGFPEIGRTFKKIAPLMSRALRGPTKKGKTVNRGRGRSATRQLAQALADNQRVLPEFRRSYESMFTLSYIGAKRTYPNYTGLALFFAGKLDDVLARASKGHKVTRNLGAVPRKLWMTVRTDYDGEYLTAFNGPLVAQNTIWTASVTVASVISSQGNTSSVLLAAGSTLDLNFASSDTLVILSSTGVNTTDGTWGAIGSSITVESASETSE